MKMVNDRGDEMYYNGVMKRGKYVYIMQAIGDTIIIGRDKQRLKTRVWTHQHQAEAYIKRHGYIPT